MAKVSYLKDRKCCNGQKYFMPEYLWQVNITSLLIHDSSDDLYLETCCTMYKGLQTAISNIVLQNIYIF